MEITDDLKFIRISEYKDSSLKRINPFTTPEDDYLMCVIEYFTDSTEESKKITAAHPAIPLPYNKIIPISDLLSIQ
jgi:hypothetical protein